jgi:hypothetical protein
MAVMPRKTQTLADVKETLALCAQYKNDVAIARGMLKVGNITDEAHEYVAREYRERIAKAYPGEQY